MTEPPDAIPEPAAAAEPAAPGPAPRRRFDSLRPRARFDYLAVVPLALAGLAVLWLVAPLEVGPLSFFGVIEEQLFVAVIVLLAPVALLARARTLALGLLVVVLVGGCLFGSSWLSMPTSGRDDLSAMSWNLEYGVRTPAEAVAQLQNVETDIIALEELEPNVSAAVQADPALRERYPYQFMSPSRGAWGNGVLSRYPLGETHSTYPPACLELLVSTPKGPVRLIVAHPSPPDITVASPLRLPVAYDSTERDAGIASIREKVDASLASGERLLVLGDFNTAPTEPEFRVLTSGLRDTHVEVGQGPGWTWRPSRSTFLPMGFLRIDLQLSAGAIRPISTSLDCSLDGDHCRVFGTYKID